MRSIMIAEDREMDRSRVEPCELQFAVEIGSFIAIRLSRFATLRFEVFDDRGAHRAVFDIHDAPRLAVADGGRQISETQQPIDQRVRHWVRLEPAHVAPPAYQLRQRDRSGLAVK